MDLSRGLISLISKLAIVVLMSLYGNAAAAQDASQSIDFAYSKVFGRAPTTAEMNGWQAQLKSKGSWSQKDLEKWMMDWLVSAAGTDERQQVILRAYHANDQTPTEEEYTYWTHEMQKRPGGDDPENHTYEDLVRYIARGRVFDSQIANAYLEALGRNPSEEELTGWRKDLGSRRDTVDQGALVHWIMDWLRSPAGAAEWPKVITRAYLNSLNRGPTKQEIQYWINEAASKRPQDDDDDEAHTYRLIRSYINSSPRSGTTSTALTRHATPAGAATDGCAAGFVWREAIPADHVCVTPQRRAETANDNMQADAHRNKTGTGDPGGCAQGFVWREAVVADHVCVLPAVRTQAAEDNRTASSRRASR